MQRTSGRRRPVAWGYVYALVHRSQKEPLLMAGLSRCKDAGSHLLHIRQNVCSWIRWRLRTVWPSVTTGLRHLGYFCNHMTRVSKFPKHWVGCWFHRLVRTYPVWRLRGTHGYQRRFVQRTCPYLVRSLWAVRRWLWSWNDRQVILVAVELILVCRKMNCCRQCGSSRIE